MVTSDSNTAASYGLAPATLDDLDSTLEGVALEMIKLRDLLATGGIEGTGETISQTPPTWPGY